MSSTGAARLSNNLLHGLNLGLAAAESTEALLSELTGTLVLGVAQQLNDAALVGSETNDLLGDFADESGAAGRLALGAGDAGLGGVEGGGFLCQKTVSMSVSPSLL